MDFFPYAGVLSGGPVGHLCPTVKAGSSHLIGVGVVHVCAAI